MSTTISSTITTGITLGSGTFTSPLTVSYTGVVSNSTAGADAIFAAGSYVNAIVFNQGLITGGKGATGALRTIGGTGGAGVHLAASGTVTNTGTITGGTGGTGGGGGNIYARGAQGGTGGAGVSLVGSLTNDGVIAGGTGGRGGFGGYIGYGGTGGVGVVLSGGGAVTNRAIIRGGYAGYGEISPTSNSYGTLASLQGIGLAMTNGGALNNGTASGSTAVIRGRIGIEAYTAAATVTNFGTILGNIGVGFEASGAPTTVANFGTISGGTVGAGIVLHAGGTIIDSGTISGGNGTAIDFGAIGGSSLLALEAGYKLIGKVIGSTAINARNTLGLAGSIGNPLTVTYAPPNLTLSNFTNVLFETGGYDTLKLNIVAGTLAGTISGFSLTSETIDLAFIGTNGSITSQSGTLVRVAGSAGYAVLKLDATDGSNFTVHSDGTSGTDLVACFCRGTRIATPDGEAAVEQLAIGDLVVTLAGEAPPVRWIGRRIYDGRFIAGNRQALPICVTAGALAEGVPARDLWLSPEHSLYLDGVLVQAKHLVNGATIVQPEGVERVEYFHIELDSHDVIIADGAPAETYVDCDNRMMFANGADYATLYPDDDRRRWQFCRPRLEWGDAALTEIRAALLWRAAALGHETDHDPELHLVADGAAIRAERVTGGVYRFAVPGGVGALYLASRAAVPAELNAHSRDTRRLGVALERLVLADGDLRLEVRHSHAGLCDGFYNAEDTHRWTDGQAQLPPALLSLFAGGFTLEVQIARSDQQYRGTPATGTRAAA